MKREIVGSRTQIGRIGIRLPHQAHPEHSHIEIFGPLDVRDAERKVAQSSMSDHNLLAFPQSLTSPAYIQ